MYCLPKGGNSGTALSLIAEDNEDEYEYLLKVQQDQPIQSGGSVQPSRLPLDVSEVSTFRYRVQDVRRAVTKAAIREARLTELKQEMMVIIVVIIVL